MSTTSHDGINILVTQDDYHDMPDLGATPLPTVIDELPNGCTTWIAALRKVLTRYKDSVEQLQVSKASHARSILDEQRALELEGEDSDDRVKVAQQSISLYASRITKGETKVAQLYKELIRTLKCANSEHNASVNEETTRKKEMLGKDVLEIIEAIERPGRAAVLAELLDYSGPIERLQELSVGGYLDEGNENQVLQSATLCLSKSDRLAVLLQGSGVL